MMDGGSSYISIGDMYKGNKVILPDRWKGKGLSVSVFNYQYHHRRIPPFFFACVASQEREDGDGTSSAPRETENTVQVGDVRINVPS